MSFIWPAALLAILLIPLGALVYVWIGRRRAARAQTYGLSPVRPAGAPMSRTERARRLVPSVLVVAGLVVLAVALARPQGTIETPRQEGTVVLAFDVSGSMAATDLQPTRMAAAQAAAKAFVEKQPSSVLIGIVAFSDSGLTVQQPTNDQVAVLGAIDRLTPQRGTSVGQGILTSLQVIEAAANGPNVDYYSNRSTDPSPSPTPVPSGYHAPAVIVLLTDGENNEQPDPVQAAQQAADRGVRIFTVGIGSAAGSDLDIEGFTVHTQLDEATLQSIADTTGGAYYSATDAEQLHQIYDHLDTQLVLRPEEIELTSIVAGLGLVLLTLGAVGAFIWLGRMP
jgi:Ca-activated chloride channel family protein